jgi:hypothetical protein
VYRLISTILYIFQYCLFAVVFRIILVQLRSLLLLTTAINEISSAKKNHNATFCFSILATHLARNAVLKYGFFFQGELSLACESCFSIVVAILL